MVRGVTRICSVGRANGFLQKRMNNLKHMDLPAKLTLGTLGAIGFTNCINEPKSQDQFIMKCSDHEPIDPDICSADYWCGLTYP